MLIMVYLYNKLTILYYNCKISQLKRNFEDFVADTELANQIYYGGRRNTTIEVETEKNRVDKKIEIFEQKIENLRCQIKK